MPAHAVASKKNSDFAYFDFLLNLSNKHINTKNINKNKNKTE